jgi:hypothetical protein
MGKTFLTIFYKDVFLEFDTLMGKSHHLILKLSVFMGRNFIELFVLLLTILGAFFSLKVGIFTF